MNKDKKVVQIMHSDPSLKRIDPALVFTPEQSAWNAAIDQRNKKRAAKGLPWGG